MALATYSDAVAYITSALNRDDADTTGNIPQFWRYAHDEIVRTLRLPLVRQVDTALISTERFALPIDFQSLEAVTYVSPYYPQVLVTDPATRAQWAQNYPSGMPRMVAVEGLRQAAFAPVPDGAYQFNLIYMATPYLMSAPTDTNTIFTQTPWLYLHGALAAGFRFNHFDDAATEHETLFRGMLADVKRQGLKDAMSGRLQPMPSMGFAP